MSQGLIKKFLPRSLYGRAVFIIVLPLVLVFPPLAIGLFMSFDSC